MYSRESMTKKLSIQGLPDEIDLQQEEFYAIREALQRGGYIFSVSDASRSGSSDRKYKVQVVPLDVPDSWKQSPRGDWYEPSLFKLNEYDRIEAEDSRVFDRPSGNESGFLYRGMSFEEFTVAKARGYLESQGGYNFEGQEGLTYFSKDADEAAFYASGFAPWQFKPTPTRPAVMVKVIDPGDHVIVPGTGENEVGIRGRISFDAVVDICYAHPIAITPGEIEINEDRWSRKFSPGSSTGMMVNVTWNKNPLGLHAISKCAENVSKAIEYVDSMIDNRVLRRVKGRCD
jgi:hypothetical protein